MDSKARPGGTLSGALNVAWVAGVVLLAGVSGCNRGGSASTPGASASAAGSATTVETDRGPGGYEHRAGSYDRAAGSGASGGARYARDDTPREAVPMFHGEPMWSESRTHSAKENAEYHFERAGADLGAKTLDDFLTKVHRFCDQPPAGALHIERANGDKLIYDPKDNIFAVATKDGAPRTIFKPTNGMSYWEQQKTREEARAQNGGADTGGYRRRSYARSDSQDGQGGGRYADTRSSRYGDATADR